MGLFQAGLADPDNRALATCACRERKAGHRREVPV